MQKMKETTFPKTVAILANAPTTTTTEEVLFVLPFVIKGERLLSPFVINGVGDVSTDFLTPLRLRV